MYYCSSQCYGEMLFNWLLEGYEAKIMCETPCPKGYEVDLPYTRLEKQHKKKRHCSVQIRSITL